MASIKFYETACATMAVLGCTNIGIALYDNHSAGVAESSAASYEQYNEPVLAQHAEAIAGDSRKLRDIYATFGGIGYIATGTWMVIIGSERRKNEPTKSNHKPPFPSNKQS